MTIDLSFFATALIVVLIPGTGVLFTVSIGITRGRSAAFWASVGCTLGIVPHLLATILGLSTLIHASALAFQIVKYVGVVYLLYLAFSTMRSRSAVTEGEQVSPQGQLSIVTKAILINVLNPKLTVFFLAFLPQFIRKEGASYLIQLTTLSLLFMILTLLVFVGYGLLANRFRSSVMESPSAQKWSRRVVAGTFASMGLRLALSER
ncbi:LysE family translocator [Pelagicoccus sp. SDUM812003]|uniref:LysE family translocator n=1 Tax=Pelagicoccus sp. SDUM812003 TaxID=3041267 RepID=UPI00280FFE30|nr:LysE family translocator [Pelagicoccus sp. SDUM812003]MDQ8203780.1 LysE family translocator [Pelagicoccus sp. SDUM812003]